MLMALAGGCAGAERPAAPAPGKEVRRMGILEHKSGQWSPGLTDAEKATLFAIAEDTLRWCTAAQRAGEFSFETYDLTPKLHARTATFVTLKVGGRLRGCIGSLTPVAPLYRSIHDNAVNAALRDPRFAAVAARELAGIDVHLSILSPIRGIAAIEEFRIGEHGIIVEKGMHRAVYLPEVAVEQKWTVEETLSSLSRKAGLPPDAWREGASFKVFSSVALSKQ
jgi:AmmeMemoRadiSam system protein A